MSQIPPPPPSQPASLGGSPSAVGGTKNYHPILAWALFPPIGSLIFLFVGKDDPDVKNNAAQAVVIHGSAFAVWIILRILTAIVLPIAIVLILWDLVWFVLWLVCLVLALLAGGKRVNIPVIGPCV